MNVNKFEYKYIAIREKKVEPFLKELGKEGWELVNFQFITEGVIKLRTKTAMIFIFKRLLNK